MRARLVTLLVVLAAATAWAVYHRGTRLTPVYVAASLPPAEPQSLLVAFEPAASAAIADGPEFNPDIDFDAGAVHADAVELPDPELPRRFDAAAGSPPAELPRVAEAQPINAQAAADVQELQHLLTQELSHLDVSQRKVWQDVLQGLSPREALEIIQIWKATGGQLPRMSMAGLDPPDGSPTPSNLVSIGDTLSSIELRDLIEANARHINTRGYRRREPAAHVVTLGSGPLPIRIDLAPGAELVTNNPFHLRIDGPGFFALRRGEVQAWTRNGEFDLSAAGELIQRRQDGDWSLDPPVRLPPSVRAMAIDRDGRVRAMFDDSSAPEIDCETIRLAGFLNPQHLQGLQDDLLTATTESGPAWTAAPGTQGCGTLRQGALEMSNATLTTEEILRQRFAPRTALPLITLPTY